MVTRRPRSTRRRPSEAAAMPLPRDDTTPPVTKMYFVELTNSPPSVGGSAVLPHIADRRPCRRRGPRAPETASRRWESRAAGAAAARVAPTAPPGQVRAGSSDPAHPACRRRHPRAGGRSRRPRRRADRIPVLHPCDGAVQRGGRDKRFVALHVQYHVV